MNSVCPTPTINFETVRIKFYYLLVFPFSYPNMATANKQAAAIFRNYNETMKSICQHCGSHFNYFTTKMTDKVQVYVVMKGLNRQCKRTLLIYSFFYMIFTDCTFIIIYWRYMKYVYLYTRVYAFICRYLQSHIITLVHMHVRVYYND